METATLIAEGTVAVPVGNGTIGRLVEYRRYQVDDGFVLEIDDLVGAWNRSKNRADMDALACWRASDPNHAIDD